MIPTIGLLLCVYLVFKGFEIFQIAISNPNSPKTAIVLGVIAVIASIGIAIIFALLFLSAGTSMPSGVGAPPPFR